MKKKTPKAPLNLRVDYINYTENDTFLIGYSGYFKDKKVLEGVYEVKDMPKLENEMQNKILDEIKAILMGYGKGVKH